MVHRIGLFLRRYDKNTIRGVGLLACWFAGSSLGLCAACVCGDAYASFLQPLTGCLPEFGGVFASAVFPLLLSACAVPQRRPVEWTCDNGQGYSLLVTPSLYHKSGIVEVYDVI